MGHPAIRLGAAVLVLLAAGLPTRAGAQSPVRLGVQGGLNFANIRGADAGETDLSTAWSLGANAWIGSGLVGLMPGLVVTRKGAIEAGPGFSSTLAVTYLQVPLLVRARLSDASTPGSIGTFFFAGPAVGLKIGCSVSASAGTNSVSVPCDNLAGDDPDALRFSSSEVSGVVGFGAQIGAASVALQYELGLSRIADEADIKTSTIAVVARYFWGAPRPDRGLGSRFP